MEDVYLYNPDSEDITVYYDLEGDKTPEAFTLKGLQIDHFPEIIANKIKHELGNRLLEKRGIVRNHATELPKIHQEIEVNMEEAKRKLLKQNG